MAREKTSLVRLAALRKSFKENKGKVLSIKAVDQVVSSAAEGKASYWRTSLKHLKAEGMNIEAVRNGRAVVGYKYVDGGKALVKVEKPAKAAPEARVAASKPKVSKKPKADKEVKEVDVDTTKVIAETPAGEEDPDVLAVLVAAGLHKE